MSELKCKHWAGIAAVGVTRQAVTNEATTTPTGTLCSRCWECWDLTGAGAGIVPASSSAEWFLGSRGITVLFYDDDDDADGVGDEQTERTRLSRERNSFSPPGPVLCHPPSFSFGSCFPTHAIVAIETCPPHETRLENSPHQCVTFCPMPRPQRRQVCCKYSKTCRQGSQSFLRRKERGMSGVDALRH